MRATTVTTDGELNSEKCHETCLDDCALAVKTQFHHIFKIVVRLLSGFDRLTQPIRQLSDGDSRLASGQK